MKVFKVFSARLANYLVKKKFKILYTEPNLKHIGLDVWCFEDSTEIRQAYAAYCEQR